jgi:hypothetical protein
MFEKSMRDRQRRFRGGSNMPEIRFGVVGPNHIAICQGRQFDHVSDGLIVLVAIRFD